MGTIVHSQANNKTDQQNQNPKNLNLNFTPYTNINSKQIVGLNVKCKTIKLLGKNSASFLPKEPMNMEFNSSQGSPMIIECSEVDSKVLTIMIKITILDHYTV